MSTIEEIGQNVGKNIIAQICNKVGSKLIYLENYRISSLLDGAIVLEDKYHVCIKIVLKDVFSTKVGKTLSGVELWLDGEEYTYRLYISARAKSCERI
ncbi:hypothetical protein [Clostridium sp. HBUAS56010]|uniref:hypothetical protein n=1 Tax=Clostridium sp. HBUAS56010 TaxID=2571127 RepID=UPI001177F307|nr:hypothetical protein [Clostridium sp. HBUAS56010]